MSDKSKPIAVTAAELPARTKPSVYPEPFASRMVSRVKHPLGDLFGLTNYGVNLTRLAPNAVSALRHAHTKQDEFVYILQGRPTLHTDEGRTLLSPGMCSGFKAGTGNGHRLVNETAKDDLVPPKIRELVGGLERAGFVDRSGKSSHRNFVHPKVAKPITISDALGDDAKHYQVRAV